MYRSLRRYGPQVVRLAPKLLRPLSTTVRRMEASTSSTKNAREHRSPFSAPPEHEASATLSAILAKALTFVPAHGWTTESLVLGAQSLGLASSAHGSIQGGPVGLVLYFMEQGRQHMLSEWSRRDTSGLRTDEKIRQLIEIRLDYLKPVIQRWPEALALLAQAPSSVGNSVGHLAQLVDDMWHCAGDKSADMNWYSKRAMLATVYTSTELYMTRDQSPDFRETYKFLERRLQDVATVGSATRQLSTMLEFGLRSAIGIAASRGNNIKSS